MTHALLQDRAVFSVSGGDRIAFLQGLITSDAQLLTQGKHLYAALLSPQGKFLHDFFLIPKADAVWIDVSRERMDDLIVRLKRYKLRSDVTITPLPDIKVSAYWGDGIPEHALIDPRLEALGARLYDSAPDRAVQGDYDAHRISLGIPDGAKDMQMEKSLLMEFGFETLHGVSFSKGCYVGQEVTARSKFRGQVRKQLYVVQADQPLPAKGSAIFVGDAEAGELLSISGNKGLALLRIELVEKSSKIVASQEILLRISAPVWRDETLCTNVENHL